MLKGCAFKDNNDAMYTNRAFGNHMFPNLGQLRGNGKLPSSTSNIVEYMTLFRVEN